MSSQIFFRRTIGGQSLSLYVQGVFGEDAKSVSFSGRLRKSRKVYFGNCGHQIRIGDQYYDARSSALSGVAVRYCKRCLTDAQQLEWDYEDDLVEQEGILEEMTEDDWGN